MFLFVLLRNNFMGYYLFESDLSNAKHNCYIITNASSGAEESFFL